LKNKLTITKYYNNEDDFTKSVLLSLSNIFESNTYLNNTFFLKYNTKNIGLVNINNIIYEINNIPDNLTANVYLSLYGCRSLTHLPDNLTIKGNLNLNGCISLTHLPDNLIVNGYLSLSRCTSLTHLPDNLIVNGDLYLDICRSLKISDDRYKKLEKQVKGKIYKLMFFRNKF